MLVIQQPEKSVAVLQNIGKIESAKWKNEEIKPDQETEG